MTQASIENLIEDVVIYMTLAEVAKSESLGQVQDELAIRSLGYFDGADLLLPEIASSIDEVSRSRPIIFPHIGPGNLGRKIDVATIAEAHKIQDASIQLLRARQISPRDVRGKVARFFPVMVAVSAGFLNVEDGTVRVQTDFWGRVKNEWVPIPTLERRRVVGSGLKFVEHRKGINPSEIRNDRIALGVSIGWQFARDVFWRVYIRPDDGFGVTFSTDSEGAQDVFRLRDIPPGRKRRAALLHWVREHTRIKQDYGATKVREHFRGQQEFHWNGLQCIIVPARKTLDQVLSQYDEWTDKLKSVAESAISVPNND